MTIIKKTISAAAGLLCVMSLSCTRIMAPATTESGHYYINPSVNPKSIGRVVVFEMDNRSSHPEVSLHLCEAIAEAFQKRHLFAVRTIHPADSDWHSLDLGRSWSYSTQELAGIREQLGADAVIYGSLTQYHPYPHLLVGVHLKMIDLRKGKLVWAIEQVWDSSDKSVALRMKRYVDLQKVTGSQSLDWQVFTMSPRAFNKFVAMEVAATFPGPQGYRKRFASSANSGGPVMISPLQGKPPKSSKKTLSSGTSLRQ